MGQARGQPWVFRVSVRKAFPLALGVLLALALLLTAACNGGDRQYNWHETHDEVRNGVRLVLSYPGWADAFIGRAENTTD